MSWQAKGLYRELLDEFWAEGSLPLDHEELADICGCSLEEFEMYWPQIEPCWEVTESGLVNAKMDTMRTTTDCKRVANAKNGQAGAIAKLANAKQLPSERQNDSSERQTPAGERQTPAGERHIAEQSRAEQSKEEKRNTSPRQARGADPRHVIFKGATAKYWDRHNPSVQMPWDASEAKQLSSLLAASPDLKMETFTTCLQNRHKSLVNHSDRPRAWLARTLDYLNGPLDQFGKPQGVNHGTNQRVDAATERKRTSDDAIQAAVARRIGLRTGGVDAASEGLLPQSDAPGGDAGCVPEGLGGTSPVTGDEAFRGRTLEGTP